MYRNIVIVRSDKDTMALRAKGFRHVFALPKRARKDRPIYPYEAEDIVRMVVQFGIVFLVAKDTPQGRKFALEAFKLIGHRRAIFWVKSLRGDDLEGLILRLATHGND